MYNLVTKRYPQIKEMKTITNSKPKIIGKSNSVHKSPHISVNLRRDIVYSARRTNQKQQQEGNAKEEQNKADVNICFKEKQHNEMLRRSLHQKDQIILSKNLKIKQLEIEMTALKMQLERFKMKNRQIALALEANKKNTCEMAQALLYKYLYENIQQNDYPNPDTMTYEELLELENKIGYVSKGLPPEKINSILLIEFNNQLDCDNKCMICQYEYEVGDMLRKIKCNHAFHRDCLDQWLNDEKICPNCKREV